MKVKKNIIFLLIIFSNAAMSQEYSIACKYSYNLPINSEIQIVPKLKYITNNYSFINSLTLSTIYNYHINSSYDLYFGIRYGYTKEVYTDLFLDEDVWRFYAGFTWENTFLDDALKFQYKYRIQNNNFTHTKKIYHRNQLKIQNNTFYKIKPYLQIEIMTNSKFNTFEKSEVQIGSEIKISKCKIDIFINKKIVIIQSFPLMLHEIGCVFYIE